MKVCTTLSRCSVEAVTAWPGGRLRTEAAAARCGGEAVDAPLDGRLVAGASAACGSVSGH